MRPSLTFRCAFLTILLTPLNAGSLNERTPDEDAANSDVPIAAAINNPDRFPSDLARDAGRKPEAVLAFAGLREGMSVLDLFSGSGYYTELAAYMVGPRGRVVAHNNTLYATIARNGTAERFANGRLASAERILGENNRLALPAAAFDVALLILCYHDIYYLDGQRGWELIDRPRMLAELYSSLRPGGAMAVAVAAPALADDGVLIFGASRNTGLEIARVLAARGETVTAFVRPTSNLENLEPLADMVVWTYDHDESSRKVYHAVGDDPLATQRMDDP